MHAILPSAVSGDAVWSSKKVSTAIAASSSAAESKVPYSGGYAFRVREEVFLWRRKNFELRGCSSEICPFRPSDGVIASARVILAGVGFRRAGPVTVTNLTIS